MQRGNIRQAWLRAAEIVYCAVDEAPAPVSAPMDSLPAAVLRCIPGTVCTPAALERAIRDAARDTMLDTDAALRHVARMLDATIHLHAPSGSRAPSVFAPHGQRSAADIHILHHERRFAPLLPTNPRTGRSERDAAVTARADAIAAAARPPSRPWADHRSSSTGERASQGHPSLAHIRAIHNVRNSCWISALVYLLTGIPGVLRDSIMMYLDVVDPRYNLLTLVATVADRPTTENITALADALQSEDREIDPSGAGELDTALRRVLMQLPAESPARLLLAHTVRVTRRCATCSNPLRVTTEEQMLIVASTNSTDADISSLLHSSGHCEAYCTRCARQTEHDVTEDVLSLPQELLVVIPRIGHETVLSSNGRRRCVLTLRGNRVVAPATTRLSCTAPRDNVSCDARLIGFAERSGNSERGHFTTTLTQPDGVRAYLDDDMITHGSGVRDTPLADRVVAVRYRVDSLRITSPSQGSGFTITSTAPSTRGGAPPLEATVAASRTATASPTAVTAAPIASRTTPSSARGPPLQQPASAAVTASTASGSATATVPQPTAAAAADSPASATTAGRRASRRIASRQPRRYADDDDYTVQRSVPPRRDAQGRVRIQRRPGADSPTSSQ